MPPANDHYYTAEPSSDHRPGEVRFCYGGRELVFATDSGVFSRRELDRGTEVLLAALPESVAGPVLDMGCGYGTIGVAVGGIGGYHGGCEPSRLRFGARKRPSKRRSG